MEAAKEKAEKLAGAKVRAKEEAAGEKVKEEERRWRRKTRTRQSKSSLLKKIEARVG